MHNIEQVVSSYLPRTKSTAGDWLSHNAVCCHHRGHGADRRGRGGIKFNPDGSLGIHCFNCGFSTGWRPGQLLGFKLKKWLQWLGVDPLAVNALSLWCLNQRDDDAVLEQYTKKAVEVKRYKLPGNAVTINEADNTEISQYLSSRHLDTDRFNFYYCPDRQHDFNNRVIIPFYYQRELVGYSARLMIDKKTIKYYTQADTTNYVFNLDNQSYARQVVVVAEGPFDAMSIDGVAVLHNDISNTQAQLIHDLHKTTVVVPDADLAGIKLIESALEYEFSCSFPNFLETCKDINEATVKYGRVYVLKDILEHTETNPTKIRLMAKKFQARFK